MQTATTPTAQELLSEAWQIVEAAETLANRARIAIDPEWLSPVDPAPGAGALHQVLARIDQRGNRITDTLDRREAALSARRPPHKLALGIVRDLCEQARDCALAADLYRQQDAR